MHILADRHIFLIERLQKAGITVSFFDSLTGLPESTEADALLVRTVTTVKAEWVKNQPNLKFVGTASAGVDHLDIAGFDENGTVWGSSPGCNAVSVSEWVVSALLFAEGRHLFSEKRSVGIAGCGNTGSAVDRMFKRFGFITVCYDPPRAERDASFTSAEMAELDKVDILTFHVPISEETRYLGNARFWKSSNKLAVINASRGGVLNEMEAVAGKSAGKIKHLLLDVWENEPRFSAFVAAAASFHSPHIAGYSFRAKIQATRQVVETMLGFFNQTFSVVWPEPEITDIAWDSADPTGGLYPASEVHEAFRDLFFLTDDLKTAGFHKLRQAQNGRTEWRDLRVKPVPEEALPFLEKLGILPHE